MNKNRIAQGKIKFLSCASLYKITLEQEVMCVCSFALFGLTSYECCDMFLSLLRANS